MKNRMDLFSKQIVELAAILIVPMIFLQMFGVNCISTRPAALVFFILDIVLIVRLRLFKRPHVVFLLLFLVWMECTSAFAGASFIKIVGGAVPRIWYVCVFGFLSAYVCRKEKRRQWILGLLGTILFSGIVTFSLILFHAIQSLVLGAEGRTEVLGVFRNGRLCAFGNMNTLGAMAVPVLLAAILLLLMFERKEAFFWKDNKTGIPCIAMAGCFGGMLLAGLILSLSRSRGAILACGAAIGVITFRVCYERWILSETKLFKRVLAVCVPALTACFTVVVLFAVKELFDAVLLRVVKTCVDAAAYREIREVLTPYGIGYALDTLTDRTLIWPAVIRGMQENKIRWLTGVTAAESSAIPINYIYENRPELSVTHAHNGYLQYLFMYGIPGFLLLLLNLAVWCKNGIKRIFSKQKEDFLSGASVCFLILAVIMGIVEVYPFTAWGIHLISYLFFVVAGVCCLEEQPLVYKEKIKLLQAAYILCAVLIVTTAVYCGTRTITKNMQITHVAVKTGMEADVKQAKERMEQRLDERFETEEFWIELHQKAGEDTTRLLMTEQEIKAFNEANRKQIVTNGMSFALEDIGEKFNGEVLKQLIRETYSVPSDPSGLQKNGVPTTREYWDQLVKKTNVEAIDRAADTRFGISVDRTILHKLPTEDALYASDDTECYYDEMAASDLPPFLPVVILHETADGDWYYVLTYGYGGWVPKEYVAVCRTRDEWEHFNDRKENELLLVVTGKELELAIGEKKTIAVPMGTALVGQVLGGIYADRTNHEAGFYAADGMSSVAGLECIADTDHMEKQYSVRIPVREADGSLGVVCAFIMDSENVEVGYLAYTQENLLRQAMLLLGTEYGWAGTHGTFDCSGFVREIYSCFGFRLPRTAKAQTGMEMADNKTFFFTGKSKREYLKSLPAGALLYFPGHISIYLGMVDDTPYCISAVGTLCTTDLKQGERIHAEAAIVSDLCYTTRANGVSWLDSTECVTVIRGK